MRPAPALTLLLLAASWPAVADPYGPDCATESLTDGNGVECLSSVGSPRWVYKSLPVAFSASEPGAFPFPGNSLPASSVSVMVHVWAEWVSGQFVAGFALAVCNDRDYDGLCRQGSPDQVRLVTSNEPFLGASCSDAEKDRKDCPDPTDAEVASFCIIPAVPSRGPNPWNPGQIVAFVGEWIEIDLPPWTPGPENVGLGLSAGTYDVWMKVGATGCTPPQCDDKLDNDGDGRIDHPADMGCSSFDDATE